MHIDNRAAARRRLLGAAGTVLVTLGLVVGMGSSALAEGGSVRYSYELIELPGGDQWGLVPVAEHKSLTGKLTKAKLFDAFNLLKSAKKATYGHSSIQITGTLPDKAEVSVKIDSAMAKSGFAPIIMAETVYTLSELGLVGGVAFPGHFNGKMTREDVPFYAYTLTLPLWRVLPDKDISGAQVRLPNGTLLSMAEFKTRWKAKDAALTDALFSYLKSSQDYTVTQVLALLPELGVAYQDQVIPLLAAESSTVRTHALRTLATRNEDQAVLTAVKKMMNTDADPALARAAAEFLGTSKNQDFAIEWQYFLLQKGTPAESVAAIDALAGRFGAQANARAGVIDALAGRLVDERAEVASASAAALNKLNATDAQVAALKNTAISEALRLRIAGELAENKDEATAVVGLTYVVAHTSERPAELAIRKLGALKSDAAGSAVQSFLSADAARKRTVSAQVLVERGDVRAMPALSAAIQKSDADGQLEAAAYRLMAAQSLATILEQSDSSDKVVKKIAYQALGERAVKEGGGAKVFEKLASGAKNSDAAIRGASASALGAFASPEALEILRKLANDKSADVRAGVARGLSQYKEGEEFEILEKYLEDSSPLVVAAAIDAMAQREEAAKWATFRSLSEGGDWRVRTSALGALSRLVARDDARGVSTVISLLSGAVSDQNRQVQLRALGLLATFNDPKATAGIALLLNAQEPELRVAAVEALGKTGHPSATDLVVSVLADSNADIRRAAIQALGDLKAKSAQATLKKRLEAEEDADLKNLIKQTLSQI